LSFSTLVKNELCRAEIEDECCLLSELAAVVRINGTVGLVNKRDYNIRIVTENAAFVRRIFSLIKKIFNINSEITIRKSKKLKKHTTYILVITASMGAEYILNRIGIDFVKEQEKFDFSIHSKNIQRKMCCKKSYLRGAFLSGGSISDPEKTYHLEIINHNKKLAQETSNLINSFRLNAKIIKRKATYVTYLKEGENIVDFLNVVGAHSALMELENIRILKEMRNNVNRIVNCETANLDKTVNASYRQVENIKYIREHIGFDNLPKNLKEIAQLRLDYNDASLIELGEKLEPVLGKSGVNHRLRKLDEIAENARELKGE
jgi:cell division protein WhiA